MKRKKISVVVSVYNNEESLQAVYDELQKKVFSKIEEDYEIVMVNDGSRDNSFEVMKHLAAKDSKVKIISLARNFGAHAADLCGLINSTGDCAVTKSADLQEPSEMILDMLDSWRRGNNIVLAVRKGRDDGALSNTFANAYYWLVRKFALKNMPPTGFDMYLADRKVISVLEKLDEKNSPVTAQLLWCGFKTDQILYVRRKREVGKSGWTFRKKFRLVTDSLFGFSTVPITFVTIVGVLSTIGSIIWGLAVLIGKLKGEIVVEGWTTLFIFNLLSFGIVMITLGILGGYLWRTFDGVRNRPVYIIEDDNLGKDTE